MSNPNKSFVQLAEKEQQAVNYVFTIKFCMVRLGRAKGRSKWCEAYLVGSYVQLEVANSIPSKAMHHHPLLSYSFRRPSLLFLFRVPRSRCVTGGSYHMYS